MKYLALYIGLMIGVYGIVTTFNLVDNSIPAETLAKYGKQAKVEATTASVTVKQ